MCLSETHVTEDVLDHEVNIQNYNMSRTNTSNPRTGEVITYVKKNINFDVLVNSDMLIQGTWINTIQIEGKDKMIICNLCRSPNSSTSHFCDNFIKFLEEYVDSNRTVISGDFNIDVNKNTHYAKNQSMNALF